jgi:septation ring formation regulator EzrA
MDTIHEHILSYFDDLDYENVNNSKDKLRVEINELNKQYIMATLQELNKAQASKIFSNINTILQNIGETSIYQEVLYRQLEEIQKELKEIYPSILK